MAGIVFEAFEQNITVEQQHLDAQNHVNNVVYLQWVQDISEGHWLHLANKVLLEKYYWVAIRHELNYKGQAYLGDNLLVRTQIQSMEGYRSVREVWIYNVNTDKLLMHSLTNWCLMAKATNKPSRIGSDFDEYLKPYSL